MPSSEVFSAPHEAWVLIPEWLRRPGVPWGSPKFWIIQAAVLAAMGFHTLVQRGLDGRDATGVAAPLTSSLMLIPVLYAALAFGVAGAIATSLWATALFGLHWLVVHGEPVTNAHLWIELVSLIVLMASGIIVGGQVGEERAGRRRTESALRSAAVAEARYRSLFENQSSPVIITDSRGVVTELNAAAHGLLGSGAAGRALSDSLGLTRAELLMAESPVAIGSVGGVVRNFVPTAQEIEVGDGRDLVQIVLADVSEECRRQEEQRALTGRLLEVQEEERLRLSRELHDDSLQQLMYLTRSLDELAENPLLAESLVDRVRSGREIATSASAALRTLIHGLRPPVLDDLGLLPALRQLVDDVQHRNDLTVVLRVSGPESRLPAEQELTAYRVVQESLNNVVRHSRARRATVSVAFGNDLVLSIRDDGQGMPSSSGAPSSAVDGGLGLIGIRERVSRSGGTVKISSRPDRGTVVRVSLQSHPGTAGRSAPDGWGPAHPGPQRSKPEDVVSAGAPPHDHRGSPRRN